MSSSSSSTTEPVPEPIPAHEDAHKVKNPVGRPRKKHKVDPNRLIAQAEDRAARGLEKWPGYSVVPRPNLPIPKNKVGTDSHIEQDIRYQDKSHRTIDTNIAGGGPCACGNKYGMNTAYKCDGCMWLKKSKFVFWSSCCGDPKTCDKCGICFCKKHQKKKPRCLELESAALRSLLLEASQGRFSQRSAGHFSALHVQEFEDKQFEWQAGQAVGTSELATLF